METKQIERLGQSWEWPADDTKLLQVFDYVEDIDTIMEHVPQNRRVLCIQAGGACGVWPWRFSQFFRNVYTFEPEPGNYVALMANAGRRVNVTPFNAALGNTTTRRAMQLDDCEAGNCGAYYTVEDPAGGVRALTIDSLDLRACDLIQLDIEGAEFEALQGAMRTLKRFRPVVVIEEKDLPHRSMAENPARELLEVMGYTECAKVHRDVVFRC